MALRREFVVALGALVALNVALAFGSIGLFVRMGPAIERILEENVDSLVAAEDILAELAESGGDGATPAGRARAVDALRRAKANVTEASEMPVLDAIAEHLDTALAGDQAARILVVSKIEALMRINRAAMHAVDVEAQRLGSGGAWAAAFVGFASFALSLIVIARIRSRVIRPLAELHEVLEAVREGDRHRRCRPSHAPEELRQVSAGVNALLDERLAVATLPVGDPN